MTEREQRLIVSRALDVGERMLLCGGEVSRVEDTIYRILKSYGASRVEVFTILSFISLTAVFDAEQVYTENRRVSIVAYSNDFARLEQLNSLSREICQTTPGLDELTERLAAIDLPPRKKQFRELYAMVGYLLSGGAFALFFGGSPLDALGAGVCCLAVWFLNWFFRRSALQRLFHAFLISFIAGALCYLVILLGLGEHPGQLMMAVIMVLIPGIAMTNAMREMLISDTISGILRLVESLLIASAVAFGFALAMFVFKDYFPEEHFTSLNAELPWLQVLAAAAGTLGFSILFNSRPQRLLLGALGGGLTWFIYLLLAQYIPQDFICVAAAAAFGAVYAEIMARVCKAPATVFTILAEIALIPGGSLYLTMHHLVGGRQTQALQYGMHTLMMALAIALGIVLITAFTTSFFSKKKRAATKHKH
ncbi:MAG: threonine/serine exporter family protein [Clostridia bacterium]|nr:threonine/serine exporter family protein [Clostridia bacterium]MBQ6866832.1 threonine/serine exporter family protein [Clostridia bacterium]MBR0422154.1 threonine/serine exporter family protein [Clostridia bacterium]